MRPDDTFPAAVAMALSNLPTETQFATLSLAGVTTVNTRDGRISAHACFLLWCHGLLVRLPFITKEAASFLLGKWATVTHDPRAHHLAIADKRFLTTEVLAGDYYDVKHEQLIGKDLPQPPMETVVYDLYELFRRNANHCRERQNASTSYERPAGSVAQP